MMHDDLLDIAQHLALLDERRPRQTSLRRAISSAYYALFHALAALCADELVGRSKPWNVYTPIYRTLDHGRAKDVFKRLLAGSVGDIAAVGQAFILLQERRHIADYDPLPLPLGRSETLDLIDRAKRATVGLDALGKNDRLFLATQLIARTRQ
jgi:hypothetical protein